MKKAVFATRFLFLAVILLGAAKVAAYSPDCTHPALTRAVADYYNRTRGNVISAGEIDELVAGAKYEDLAPRWVNHFYDPVYDRGWTDKLGVLRDLCNASMQIYCITALPSPDWALSSSAQLTYGFFEGDYSWPTGIQKGKEGYLLGAQNILGHILHLTEDATVPAHVRDDTHIFTLINTDSGWQVIKGDPLEVWIEDDCQAGNLSLDAISSRITSIPAINDLKSAMQLVARKTNWAFFSADTINDPNYAHPIAANTVKKPGADGLLHDYAVGKDFDNQEYRLARKSKISRFVFHDVWTLDYACIRDNWERSAKLAITYGAAIMDLYLRSIDAAKRGCRITDEGGIDCVGVDTPDGGVVLSDGGVRDGGMIVSDGGVVDGGIARDGGVAVDGGIDGHDGGFVRDGGQASDGGVPPDGGAVFDGGLAQDGGIVADGGHVADGGLLGTDGGVSVYDGGVDVDGGTAQDGGIADGGCIPNCQAKECGDNGCGGSCGGCNDNEYCKNDLCILYSGSCGDMSGLQTGSPWPMFNYCPTHLGRSPFRGPDDPVLKWALKLDYPSYAQPVVSADGTVYVRTGGYGGKGRLYAVYPDGTLRWMIKTPLDRVYYYQDNSSPVIGYDGTIYAYLIDEMTEGPNPQNFGAFYGIYPDGTEKWRRSVNGSSTSSPLIAPNGIIYFVVGNTFNAYNSDGLIMWSVAVDSYMAEYSPAIDEEGTIYVSTYKGLMAFYPAGDTKWLYNENNPDFHAVGHPLVNGEVIYFSAQYYGNGGGVGGEFMKAVDKEGARSPIISGKGSVYPFALGRDGVFYIKASDGRGYLVLYACFNNNNEGEWFFQPSRFPYSISSSAVIDADNIIYVGDEKGSVYALRADGSIKWEWRPLNVDMQVSVNAVIVGGDNIIYGVNRNGYIFVLSQ